MSAERGATPGAPDGGMESPEAVAIRFASQLHADGLVDAVAAMLRARDEEWTRRVAQGWAEGRDAAEAPAREMGAFGVAARIRTLLPPKAGG